MSDEEMLLDVTGGQLSMDQLLGADMEDIVENPGFVQTPVGTYHWRVKNCEIKPIEVANPDDSNGPKLKRPAFTAELEILNCLAVISDQYGPDDMIGKKHQENIFITELERDLGKVKWLMVHAGLQGSGPLQELMNAFHGHEFVSKIKQRADKNDKDKKYSNIDMESVQPVENKVEAA